MAQTAELATTQQRLKAMMAEHERTQSALFELTARSEEERAAQAAQNEMATAEVGPPPLLLPPGHTAFWPGGTLGSVALAGLRPCHDSNPGSGESGRDTMRHLGA